MPVNYGAAVLFDLPMLALIAAVFLPLERLAPIARGRPFLRPALALDLKHLVLSAAAIRFGVLAIAAVAVAAGRWAPPAFGEMVRAQPLWLQFIEALLIADFGFYWMHRAFHAAPNLWRIHMVHHSIEQLDWIAAYRVHPVDQVLTKGFSIAPLFAIGFSAEALALFGAVYAWQSLLIHSNADIRFGPLKYVLVSPQFHHWHHANEPQAHDKNFSAQLTLWDYVFGTAHQPGSAMPSRYGIEAPTPQSWLGQMAHALPPRGRKSEPTAQP